MIYKQSRKNPVGTLTQVIGLTALVSGGAYLLYRMSKSKKEDESGVDSENIVTNQEKIKFPIPLPPPTPELRLAYRSNYYDKANLILCDNITEREVEIVEGDTTDKDTKESKKVTKQFYTPLTKPADYVKPGLKKFERSCGTNTTDTVIIGHKKQGGKDVEITEEVPNKGLPTFSEEVTPASNPDGFIAYTQIDQDANMQKTAYALGLIETPDTAITPNLELPESRQYDAYLPDSNTLIYLAKIVACEIIYQNTFDKQREMAGVLWCLINRVTTGSTKMKERSVANFVKAIEPWVGYNPDTLLEGNDAKKAVASCLVPFVKAFFRGFFNDETHGSTHWAHIDAMVKRCPPAYYYPQGTKTRGGLTIEPYKLRPKSVKNYYINRCLYVKVDESLNGN